LAPRLTELTLAYPISEHPKLPWGQLHTVSYTGLYPDDLAPVISQLSLCPQITRLAFHHLYVPQPSPDVDARALPALICDVHDLTFGFYPDSHVDEESPTVVEFLGCITLRCARALHLEADCTRYPAHWSHNAFLAFSERSSLHDTLRTLEISNLAISASQLLQCLSGLPRLEKLSVSDPTHWPYTFSDTCTIDTEPDMFLINDALLRGLTWTPKSDSALVCDCTPSTA